jgi:serine/threonine protein kinase
MLATLNHPCILRAHDLCRVDGRIALVTEYVEGIDLARCAKPDRLLPPRVVVSALGEVADALHSAWTSPSPETGRPLQLIHRDIKPENIRLTIHGQVKLLDFGIARTTEMFRNAKTRVGDLPFTPGYAAPESFRRGEQGPASDVYALGVTMYRLLLGERLYEGMGVGDQFAIASLPDNYEPWLKQRLAKLTVDRDAAHLVATMLAYEKEDRPTARQAREACEELSDRLLGPQLSKWARTVQFPPTRDVKDASLTGRTLKEDSLVGDTLDGEGGRREEAKPARAEKVPLSRAYTPDLMQPDRPAPTVSRPPPSPSRPPPEAKPAQGNVSTEARRSNTPVTDRIRPAPGPGRLVAMGPRENASSNHTPSTSGPPPVPAGLGGSVRPSTASSAEFSSVQRSSSLGGRPAPTGASPAPARSPAQASPTIPVRSHAPLPAAPTVPMVTTPSPPSAPASGYEISPGKAVAPRPRPPEEEVTEGPAHNLILFAAVAAIVLILGAAFVFAWWGFG